MAKLTNPAQGLAETGASQLEDIIGGGAVFQSQLKLSQSAMIITRLMAAEHPANAIGR